MFIYLNSGTACVAESPENQQLMFGHLIGCSRPGLGHWVAGARPGSHLIVSVFLLWFYIPTVIYTVTELQPYTQSQSENNPLVLGQKNTTVYVNAIELLIQQHSNSTAVPVYK